METSFYDFKMKAIDGQEVAFDQFKGKKVLLVNTASACGFTPQYNDLQLLHQEKGEKVTVLGFPANDFGAQEPGSNETIAEFCSVNFGVSFPLFQKIAVTGPDRHPLYSWLEQASGRVPNWNFCKYLVDENGAVIAFFPSAVGPMDEALINQL